MCYNGGINNSDLKGDIMATVTQRIKQVKQPRGGYVKPRAFEQIQLEDILELNSEENIHPSLMGLVVDYMTRVFQGAVLDDAFEISLRGATLIGKYDYADKLLDKINGLNDDSIEAACKMVGFDVVYRAGIHGYVDVETIKPNEKTMDNIRIMIKRSMDFFERFGPVTKDGFTFEGGYTDVVDKGDGDFLTKDTLWDFKVSKSKPTSAHTLQLLMYYLMGKKSIHVEFKTISKLGIFNPRLNVAYLIEIKDIDEESIKNVSREVIGY